MPGWDSLVHFFALLLISLSQSCGGNLGLAIIIVSVITRLALLPLTLRVARVALAQQRIILKLSDEIKTLRRRYRSNPRELAAKLSELYRRNGVKPITGANLAGGALQALVGGGLCTSLRRGLAQGHRFLWIGDLGRPDALLTLATGAITFAASMLGPHLGEQSRTAAAVLPATLTLILAWRLSSAIVLYWASSAAMNGAQAFILRDQRRS
jgi:YidC/Oxa1 family membrane protein insertase